jgi:hypothetical protein
MFGVPTSANDGVYARTNINGTVIETRIPGIAFNAYNNLRIAINTANVTYYVNNTLVATHNVSTATGLNIFLSNTTTRSLQADWIRVDKFPATGSFRSATIDSGNSATTWTNLNWAGTVPTGTTLTIQTQTSVNGTTWSSLSTASSTANIAITNPPGRYLRYIIVFTPSTDLTYTPALSGITLTYTPQA